jgi:DNA-binding response OmpR family regulator
MRTDADGRTRPFRILIVEDEPAMRRGLKDTFETRGFEVLTAADGETGRAAALNASADLILLDIMLPRVNGSKVTKR